MKTSIAVLLVTLGSAFAVPPNVVIVGTNQFSAISRVDLSLPSWAKIHHSRGVTMVALDELPATFRSEWGISSEIVSNKLAAIAIEAENKAKANIAERKRRAESAEKEIGPAPIVNPETGTACVRRYLKSYLRDPDSVQYIGWSAPQLVTEDGQSYWRVRVQFRAKNGFGGYGAEDGLAYIQKGAVVKYVKAAP